MSGHYSPLNSSQEFVVASRHKLPTVPSPKPASTYNAASAILAQGANSSWMNKPSYSNVMHATNSSSSWCNSSSQSEKADVRIPPNREQSQLMNSSIGSHTLHLSKSIIESSKTASVNGDVLPINGSAKLKPANTETVVITEIVKTTNSLEKPLIKSNNIAEIVPPDEVESVLETMFESDNKPSTPISTAVDVTPQKCKLTPDMIGESVENILASPSPAKGEDVLSEADILLEVGGKLLIDDVVALESECDRSLPPSNDVEVKLNTPDKKVEQSSLHSNGTFQSTKSHLERALLAGIEKCDGPKNDHNLNKNMENIKNETKKDTSNEETYVEVESELAKMFAGIEDSETVKTSNVTDIVPVTTISSTLVANTSITNSVSLPNISDGSSMTSSQLNLNVPEAKPSSSTASVLPPKPKKTYKKKRTSKPKSSTSSMKNSKMKNSCGKENSSLDSVTMKRVPVIHIEGSKENPISVQIINSIKTEEEESSENKSAAKRKSGKSDRPIKRSATDYVLKNYDPSSSDSSWICIFCKLCAHHIDEAGEPSGDLFGPYFIKDPDKKENELLSFHQEHSFKKQKRSESRERGRVGTSLSEEKSMEVWAHENCFIWAPGVHLLGSKLMGLDDAVWDALQTKCIRCGKNGANIGCKVRQCKSFTHHGCALLSGWTLDVEKFLSVCDLHSVPD